jgi:hypothetical protein
MMTAFTHATSPRKRLVVLALPALAGSLWLSPSALAAPPDQQRDVTADDGSTFSVTYHNPPKAEGIASSFQIAPDSATGPAEGASRFVYHEVLITNSNGVVLQQGDAANSVGRNHPLVTISYQGVQNPDDTINRTGFYLPAKPGK